MSVSVIEEVSSWETEAEAKANLKRGATAGSCSCRQGNTTLGKAE